MEDLYVVRFAPFGEGEAGELPEEDEGTDVKTTFAHFGLAFYAANVLEHGLVNVLALSRVLQARAAREMLEKDPWEQRFRDTIKELLRRVTSQTAGDPQLEADLSDAVRLRNHLAHNFWRERAEDFCSNAGRAEMIRELRAARDHFVATDLRLTQVSAVPLQEAAGVPAEALDAMYEQMRQRAERRDRG